MIYISGKITGNDYAEDMFKTTEDYLSRKYDEMIINPYRVNAQLPKLSHDEYMQICFSMIDLCNKVYFMENWRESCGASQEMGYAIAKGKIILFN